MTLTRGLRPFLYCACLASSCAQCLGFVAHPWVQLFCDWWHPGFPRGFLYLKPDSTPPRYAGTSNKRTHSSWNMIGGRNLIDWYKAQWQKSLGQNQNVIGDFIRQSTWVTNGSPLKPQPINPNYIPWLPASLASWTVDIPPVTRWKHLESCQLQKNSVSCFKVTHIADLRTWIQRYHVWLLAHVRCNVFDTSNC